MKICYVANSRFPSERAHMTQIVHMCNAFAHAGHEVTLLVTDRKNDVSDTPEMFFGVSLNFSIVRISVPDVAGCSSKIPKFLRPLLFTIQRIVFAWNATQYTKSSVFDFVYGRDEWILWCMSLFSPVHLAWESHEARYSFGAKQLIEKRVPIVVISEGVRDFYVAKGVPTESICIAHDAVDERFFETHVATNHARVLLGVRVEKPIVMYIGGLEAWKGVRTLFVATKAQDVFETYVIGGKIGEVEAYGREYPHIHFLGPRPYRDLPALQQAADMLVIPNTANDLVSARYTSPLKLFAHMTSKKPIVASRVLSIENVVSDDEVFFFNADDSDDLRRTILTILGSKDECAVRAERAYQKSTQYTWQHRAHYICNFLTSTLRA